MLGMPSASSIGFEGYLIQNNLMELAIDFASMLDRVCEEKYGKEFQVLEMPEKMLAINNCKLVNVRVFSGFVSHLLKAYYTAPNVARQIGAGSVPPFPQGNFLMQDDWGLLEPVFERGKVYRDVS